MMNTAMHTRTPPTWLYILMIGVGAAGVSYWVFEIVKMWARVHG